MKNGMIESTCTDDKAKRYYAWRASNYDGLAEWEQEAKSELKVYRKRLPKETYQKILENFMRTKTHRYFEVGELSLFLLQ